MKDTHPMDQEIGSLQIRICVRWQERLIPHVVFKKHVERARARDVATEFFKQNPYCAELDPEVTWTYQEHLTGWR